VQREIGRDRLRGTWSAAVQPNTVLGRRRFVAAARVPPSRSRAAAGRCTARRHHRSHRDERHASSTRRRGTSPRATSPLPPRVDAVIVRAHRNRAIADAAPRSCSAGASVHRVGAAQLSAAKARENPPALATPGRAAQPNPVGLTPPRRVSAGVARRNEQRSPARSREIAAHHSVVRRAANSAARTDRQGPCLRT
jgi:hypothetical protein